MRQVDRQLVDAFDGFVLGKTHLIIDRDTKYCEGFRPVLESAGVRIVLCPPRVPQCNGYAERFVRSIKGECLSLSCQKTQPILYACGYGVWHFSFVFASLPET